MKDREKKLRIHSLKNTFHHFSLSVFSILSMSLPSLLLAAKNDGCDPIKGTKNGLPCLTTQDPTSLSAYLASIRDYLLGFSAALAVLFIVWGGFVYITSAGNEKRVENAKQTLTYAIIGLILVLLAKVILTLITGDLLSSVFTGDSPYEYNK